MPQYRNPHTFVLVHGAWHGGWCWRRVADLLTRGPKVFTPTLTGLGERSHLMGGHQCHHARHRRGQRHEMGAARRTWCCAAIPTAAWWSRASPSKSPAIASIVFLDAFVPENGEAMVDLTAQAVRDAEARRGAAATIGVPARPAAAFLVNEKDQAWVDCLTGPQPIGTMTEKIKLTGARERIAKKAYIRAATYPNPGFDKALARVEGRPGVAHLRRAVRP